MKKLKLFGVCSLAVVLAFPSILRPIRQAAGPAADEHTVCLSVSCLHGEPSSSLVAGNATDTGVQRGSQNPVRWLGHGLVAQFIRYTPPSCSDTDSDQTNNCGPNDSGDAGTRLLG